MLGHRSNDRDMNFGVACVPQAVKPTSPRCNGARYSKQDQSTQGNQKDDQDGHPQQGLELFIWHLLSSEIDKSDKLQKTEDALRIDISNNYMKDIGKLTQS